MPTAIKHERKSPGRVNECSCKVQTQRGQTLQTGAGNHLLLRKPPLDTTRALMETWPCASSTSRQTAAYTLSAHHNKHVRRTPMFSPCRAPSWERRREASDYHNSTQQVTQLQMPPILGDKMWGFFTYVHPVQWQKRSFRLSGMWRQFQLKFPEQSWTGDLYKKLFLKRDRCCPDGWTKRTITLFLHFSYLIAAQVYVIT